MTSWKSVVNVFIGEGSDYLCQVSRRGQIHEHRCQKEKNMLQLYFNTILVTLWAQGLGGRWKYKKRMWSSSKFCCVLHKNAHSYSKLSCLPDWSCLLLLPETPFASRITSLKDCILTLTFFPLYHLSCWPVNIAVKNRPMDTHVCLPHTQHGALSKIRLHGVYCRTEEGRENDGATREGIETDRGLMKGGRDGGNRRKTGLPTKIGIKSQFTEHWDIWRNLQGNEIWHWEQRTCWKTVLIPSK